MLFRSEGKTGYTYPIGNVKILAQKMIDIIEKLKNQKEEISNSIEKKIKIYSMERATQGLQKALSRL